MRDRFQILSLDGGGIKGLFSAAMLTHIEQDLGVSITNHFDLITGTSTGGIIAIGLGLGMSPEEILRFYLEKGGAIFPSSLRSTGRWLRHPFRHKHDPRDLEIALKDCFQNRLLGESRRMLVIPSFNLADTDVALFKTAHDERFRRDYRIPAWKVAMATAAAPTYFPGFTGIDHMNLIDGGVWANNPCMVALTEAIGILRIPPENIRILSIGTFEEISSPPQRLMRGGWLQWGKHATETILAGQNAGASKQAALIVGKENMLRVSPNVPKGLFTLDGFSPGKLLAKASHNSRHEMPRIHNMFLDHRAPDFTPFHTP